MSEFGNRDEAVAMVRRVQEMYKKLGAEWTFQAIKRKAPGTIDRDLAKRGLSALREEQSQIDRSKNKLTLAELCDQYFKTVQHQKPKTLERKAHIVGRIKRDWPTGSLNYCSKYPPRGSG